MSTTEHLRRLLRRLFRRLDPLPLDDRARALQPVSLQRELGHPAAGTMAVQPLHCPDASSGGYC